VGQATPGARGDRARGSSPREPADGRRRRPQRRTRGREHPDPSSRFTDAWAVAGDGDGHTWTVDNPLAAKEIARLLGDPSHRRRIDYVLAGPPARVRSAALVGTRPVDGVWLSDHFGVLADVDVP
jgi:endonuclease/exonuclease/phosphatase family metal-dependent hydrolase